jgi:hypothetical protein
MKILSPKLTAIVMKRRDDLKKSAYDLRTQAERAFSQAEAQAASLMQTAKTAVHAARIQANRMEKEADLLQEALNEELELQVKEEQDSSSAWDIKSQARLKAELDNEVS